MTYTDPNKRHEFVLLFDVQDGNPNGDPDAGNLPRVDPETMHGLVTDVCLKRKVRDYLQLTRGLDMFIQSRVALNTLIQEAGKAVGAPEKSARSHQGTQVELCRRYYDIRMFGAVLSTGDFNAGQVRGPVQLTFARSVDPVQPLDWTVTRKAVTTEADWERKETEMGRKPNIPYGLYRTHGFFNPFLAQQTKVTEEDLQAFWEALTHLFDFDRSAARGEMTVRGLYVFTHENEKGNAPAHRLFELIRLRKRDGIESPRRFEDYLVEAPAVEVSQSVSLEAEGFKGVTLTRLA